MSSRRRSSGQLESGWPHGGCACSAVRPPVETTSTGTPRRDGASSRSIRSKSELPGVELDEEVDVARWRVIAASDGAEDRHRVPMVSTDEFVDLVSMLLDSARSRLIGPWYRSSLGSAGRSSSRPAVPMPRSGSAPGPLSDHVGRIDPAAGVTGRTFSSPLRPGVPGRLAPSGVPEAWSPVVGRWLGGWCGCCRS